MSTTENSGGLDCPICDRSGFDGREGLGIHMSLMHDTTLLEYERRDNGLECPTCGRSDFRARKGLGLHHKRKHGISIAEYERRQVDGYQCPSCERSDFETKQGLYKHHAYTHGESLVTETRTCDWCGEEFTRPRSEFTDSEHNFCGEDCYGKWHSENHVGEDASHYKGGKIEVECANCGDSFEKFPSDVAGTNFSYCSHECQDEHRSEVYVGENHPTYARIAVKCYHCGDELEVVPARYEKQERFFCSQECKAATWSDEFAGGGNPSWKGGVSRYYGSGFSASYRSEIRSRDGKRCQDCGMTAEQHMEKFGRDLEVHHIIPFRLFEDGDEAAHQPDNLITLCRPCHRKWEQMPGLRPA